MSVSEFRRPIESQLPNLLATYCAVASHSPHERAHGTKTPEVGYKLHVSGNIKQTSGGLTRSGDATVGGDLAVSGETTLDHVIIGDGGQGTRTIGVVDYQNLNSCSTVPDYCNDYIHLKMPTQFNKDPCAEPGVDTGCSNISDMFHIHVTGYAYGVPSVIDITFVGYVTYVANSAINDGLIRTKIFDATGTSCDTSAAPGGVAYQGCAIYHGSDDRLYLRFKPSSLYHIAFSVDSMYVGNGYVLKRNDIEVVNDPSASL